MCYINESVVDEYKHVLDVCAAFHECWGYLIYFLFNNFFSHMPPYQNMRNTEHCDDNKTNEHYRKTNQEATKRDCMLRISATVQYKPIVHGWVRQRLDVNVNDDARQRNYTTQIKLCTVKAAQQQQHCWLSNQLLVFLNSFTTPYSCDVSFVSFLPTFLLSIVIQHFNSP